MTKAVSCLFFPFLFLQIRTIQVIKEYLPNFCFFIYCNSKCAAILPKNVSEEYPGTGHIFSLPQMLVQRHQLVVRQVIGHSLVSLVHLGKKGKGYLETLLYFACKLGSYKTLQHQRSPTLVQE